MIRLLLRLYPAEWRRRYGSELADLLHETGMTPHHAADLVRGAGVEHGRAVRARLARGGTMTIGIAWRHPTTWAVVAALVLAPTAVFVGVSMLAYGIGVPGLAAAVDPVITGLARWRVIDLFLVVAPALAFLAAVVPLLRLELHGGEAIVAVRARAANLAVACASAILGGLLVAHILSEAILEAGP